MPAFQFDPEVRITRRHRQLYQTEHEPNTAVDPIGRKLSLPILHDNSIIQKHEHADNHGHEGCSFVTFGHVGLDNVLGFLQFVGIFDALLDTGCVADEGDDFIAVGVTFDLGHHEISEGL